MAGSIRITSRRPLAEWLTSAYRPSAILRAFRNRAGSLLGAVRATAGCDLVFLEPDNGVVSPAVGRHTNEGTQYAYLDELRAFVELGKSVVVIHFPGRTAPHLVQIRERLREVRGAMPVGTPSPLAVWWRRRVSLAFLVIPAAPEQAGILRGRVQRMLDSLWGRFWRPPVALQSRESRERKVLTNSQPQVRPTR